MEEENRNFSTASAILPERPSSADSTEPAAESSEERLPGVAESCSEESAEPVATEITEPAATEETTEPAAAEETTERESAEESTEASPVTEKTEEVEADKADKAAGDEAGYVTPEEVERLVNEAYLRGKNEAVRAKIIADTSLFGEIECASTTPTPISSDIQGLFETRPSVWGTER